MAAGEQPVSYAREAWCENVTYYSANRGARSLIVAFYDGGRCVGVPISYFLQMLRDDLYDVLALNDPRKLFFDRRIPGFSTSFLETSRAVEAFAKARGFDEVITFGASMGAYPALRAGLCSGPIGRLAWAASIAGRGGFAEEARCRRRSMRYAPASRTGK